MSLYPERYVCVADPTGKISYELVFKINVMYGTKFKHADVAGKFNTCAFGVFLMLALVYPVDKSIIVEVFAMLMKHNSDTVVFYEQFSLKMRNAFNVPLILYSATDDAPSTINDIHTSSDPVVIVLNHGHYTIATRVYSKTLQNQFANHFNMKKFEDDKASLEAKHLELAMLIDIELNGTRFEAQRVADAADAANAQRVADAADAAEFANAQRVADAADAAEFANAQRVADAADAADAANAANAQRVADAAEFANAQRVADAKFAQQVADDAYARRVAADAYARRVAADFAEADRISYAADFAKATQGY